MSVSVCGGVWVGGWVGGAAAGPTGPASMPWQRCCLESVSSGSGMHSQCCRWASSLWQTHMLPAPTLRAWCMQHLAVQLQAGSAASNGTLLSSCTLPHMQVFYAGALLLDALQVLSAELGVGLGRRGLQHNSRDFQLPAVLHMTACIAKAFKNTAWLAHAPCTSQGRCTSLGRWREGCSSSQAGREQRLGGSAPLWLLLAAVRVLSA